MNIYKGLIFDLDGVLVDTAKYHYLAWKEIAGYLGIRFTIGDNERLKGVSRMRSLEIMLEIGGLRVPDFEKESLCAKKNDIYLSYVRQLSENDLLIGAENFLVDARKKKYGIALGSASKNSLLVLERLNIAGLFDAVIDGNNSLRAKPDPEVFIKGAEALGVINERCIVFEDSVAGIQAAHAAGMKAVGVGNIGDLPEADIVIPGLAGNTIDTIISLL